MSSYFTAPATVINGVTSDADDVNDLSTAVEAGFDNVEAAIESLDDTYLGAKASDPATDNDGNALIDGAIYFNTTDNYLKVYDLGTTTWIVGVSSTPSLADESSDTTCFPIFATDATGNQALKTDTSNLTYNASTGILSTELSGNVTGDLTGNADNAYLIDTQYIVTGEIINSGTTLNMFATTLGGSWTVTKLGTGSYKVNHPVAFSTLRAVATPYTTDTFFATIYDQSISQFTINIYDETGAAVDSSVYFIAFLSA